ncbi:MAG TPA: twin-arginine translocase TatA/TatE family subunit [Microbacteriaceae bacterium]|nr:twin-arginine translocase TatA/TatE family subunit [Microbacteriaceae bacterium]
MRAIFENPIVIIAIVVLLVLIFAGPKLPGLAKSLGQSMRIFRKEVKTMKSESAEESASVPPAPEPPSPSQSAPVNGEDGKPTS